MYTNARPTLSVQNAAGGFGSRMREILAYIISPVGHWAPSAGDMTKFLSTALNRYYVGVVALAEAAVALFGTKGTGESVIPGSYPLEPVRHSEGISEETGSGGNPRDSRASSVLEELGHSGANASIESQGEREDHVPGLREHSCPDLIDSHPKPSSPPPTPSVGLAEAEPPQASDSIVDHAMATEPPARSGPKPLLLGKANIPRQQARYSGQRTLRAPGTGPPRHPLPKLAYLETRAFRHEQEVARSPELQYTACELADKGIFLHHPVDDVKFAGAYLSTARLHREMTVGPLKRHWRWKGKGKGAPKIEVSGPEDPEAAMVSNTNRGPTSTVEHSAPVALASPSPTHAGARRTRNRSNALRMPAQSTSRSRSIEPTNPNPFVAPIREILLVALPSVGSPAATPGDTSPAQVVRWSCGERSNITHWLTQLGAGDNPLVYQSFVADSIPELEAFFPSSPPSSPESSPPCTPVIDAASLPLVEVVEESEEVAQSGVDRRRRARCSYDGGKCDVVVAPVIPEELLTDEIGVAC